MTLRLASVTKRVGAETHLCGVDLELRPGTSKGKVITGLIWTPAACDPNRTEEAPARL
ncbi:MAG: hypothetical protein ACREH3_12980 [Geminicoccales bacterium]